MNSPTIVIKPGCFESWEGCLGGWATVRFFRLPPGPLSLLLLLAAALIIGIADPARGDAESESPVRYHTREFHLRPGEGNRLWSLTFDLPEETLRRGAVFVARRVFTSGDLEIVSESLVRNRYAITLLLAPSSTSGGRGTLFLQLETGAPRPVAPLPAPVEVGLASGPWPFTIEAGMTGTHLAAAVIDCASGEPVWQRVFSPHSVPLIDAGALAIGKRYLLKLSQSDESARQSPATCLSFRVAARRDLCPTCHGTGHRAERAADPERAEPCPACAGIGGRLRPFPIVEAVCPDQPDMLAEACLSLGKAACE